MLQLLLLTLTMISILNQNKLGVYSPIFLVHFLTQISIMI